MNPQDSQIHFWVVFVALMRETVPRRALGALYYAGSAWSPLSQAPARS